MCRFLVVVAFWFLFVTGKGQTPAVEVRAVWLTTNWNLDWPNPNHSIELQKAHLKSILDKLQQLNINTVFFQSRIRGDVFYNSQIEPISPYAKKGFDYLQFAIEECHKRGIECHAWFVTFPVGSRKQVAAHGKNSVVNKKRSICKLFNGEWYLDPGNPEARTYLVSLVDEIIKNYDVDGVHFDYIRYPEKAIRFPDNDTFKKYGNGMALNDWRRNNINILVSDIYDRVKASKPWVQVSSSPIGKYKDLGAQGSSWTAYSSVFQDAIQWVNLGKHDALYPMLYYKENDFYPYLDDWKRLSSDRLLVAGIGVYQMLPSEKNWDLKNITDQIDYIRENRVGGQAFFRAGNVLDNEKGIGLNLRDYYQYPAKLPAMTWLDNIAPNSPVDLEVYKNENGKLCLKWQAYEDDEKQYYTVYCSFNEDIETNNPQNVLATGIRGNYIELDMEYGDFGLYYSVTASDRYHNESVVCFPAYFVHSEFEK